VPISWENELRRLSDNFAEKEIRAVINMVLKINPTSGIRKIDQAIGDMAVRKHGNICKIIPD